MWLGLEWGDWISLAALGLSVIVAIVAGTRALIVGRRARIERQLEEMAAAEKLRSAQAEAVSVWVEEVSSGASEVVVRNGSPNPIRFVAILIDRVGARTGRAGDVDHEIVTYRSIGPMRGVRAAVTLTPVSGSVLADARVRFVDYQLQGWERDFKGHLSRSDYTPEQFGLYDSGVRPGHSTASALDSGDETSDFEQGSSEFASGRWRFPNGNGHTTRLTLVPEGVSVGTTNEITVMVEDLPRLAMKFTEEGRIVEFVLLNLPDPMGENGEFQHLDITQMRFEDGSALFSFVGNDPECVSELGTQGLPIQFPNRDEELGVALYDDLGNPIAIHIFDYRRTLPKWLDPDRDSA